MLTQYRERLHLKNAQKGIQQKKTVTSQFTGLKTVAILLDATNGAIRQKALNYTKKLAKQAGTTEVIGYVDVKVLTEELPFEAFCKKDLDWLWRPKGVVVASFQRQKFDLLINLSQTDCFPLEHLATTINANYKIGALTDYPNDYNLMVDAKSLDKYLEQVNFFIKKLSNN
ncbi:MAG: hypothetical protein AAGJ18_13480 [Bacteroidota bacterium]